MQHRASLTFSADQVRRYCELAGDHNAIHRDLAAAQLRFPDVDDIVVPGGLVQIAITGIFGSDFPGDGALGLTFAPERFRKPLCPGDRIEVVIEVTRVRGEIIEVEITVQDEDGEKISSATSRILAPDQNYQQWWQQQTTARV